MAHMGKPTVANKKGFGQNIFMCSRVPHYLQKLPHARFGSNEPSIRRKFGQFRRSLRAGAV